MDGGPIIAGAGLAGGLIALRLGRATLVEAGEPFGNHTWSFHDADLTDAARAWIAPAVAHRWPRQDVRFAGLRRTLDSGYASLTSESLAAALGALPGVAIRRGAVAEVGPGHIRLSTGERIEAPAAIDARGYVPSAAQVLGFQKFVGWEVETEAPHGVAHPVIMDATVPQIDGYRFVYLLPFSPTRILIEDTRYADGPALDPQALGRDISAYADAAGWRTLRVVRTEEGVLPITLAFDADAFWAERPEGVPQAGMRAGLFHPVTGYSLPDAVRVADLVADLWPCDGPTLARALRDHALRQARAQGFYRLLNRMLFRAADPHARHRVMERFYGLSTPLIERFYAGRSTLADRARILAGKPPVPISRALAVLREASVQVQEPA